MWPKHDSLVEIKVRGRSLFNNLTEWLEGIIIIVMIKIYAYSTATVYGLIIHLVLRTYSAVASIFILFVSALGRLNMRRV